MSVSVFFYCFSSVYVSLACNFFFIFFNVSSNDAISLTFFVVIIPLTCFFFVLKNMRIMIKLASKMFSDYFSVPVSVNVSDPESDSS